MTKPTSDQARASAPAKTPNIVTVAVDGLVQLWKLDPEAAYSIADANRLHAQLRREIREVHPDNPTGL